MNRSNNIDFAGLPLETRIDVLAFMADYDWVNVECWMSGKDVRWEVVIGTYISDVKPIKRYSFYKGDFDKKAIDMACLLKYGTNNL